MIEYFYLFHLFKSAFIISNNNNSFQNGSDTSFKSIIKINLEFMRIIVFLDMSLDATIYYIKIFCLKLFKIYLNISLKFIVLDVYSYTDIESICNPLIKKVKVNCLNTKNVTKKAFKLAALLLWNKMWKWIFEMLKKPAIVNTCLLSISYLN